jgi:ATP synthase H subunit
MGRADILKTIKQAEADAATAVEKAREEASRNISDARVKASDLEASGKRAAEAEAQKIIQTARESAETEAVVVADSGGKNIDSIHNAGDKARHDAVQAVLNRFME